MSSANSLPYGVNDTAVRTTLTEALTSTETGVNVGEVTNAPSTPFLIAVWVDQSPLREDDMEIMEVTGVSGTTLTVTRGAKGTTAQSFSSGDKVFMGVVSSDMFDSLKDETGYIRENVSRNRANIAEIKLNDNLSKLNYKSGFFDVFENTDKIQSYTTNHPFNGTLGPFVNSGLGGFEKQPQGFQYCNAIEWTSDGRLYAADDSGYSENVIIFDNNLNIIDKQSVIGGQDLNAMSIGPNGRLAVASDSETGVYDSNFNQIYDNYHSSKIYNLTWTDDGRLIVPHRSGEVREHTSDFSSYTSHSWGDSYYFGVDHSPYGHYFIGGSNNFYILKNDDSFYNDTFSHSWYAAYDGAFRKSDGKLAIAFGDSTSGKIEIYDGDTSSNYGQYTKTTELSMPDDTREVEWGPGGELFVGLYRRDTSLYVYDENLNQVDSDFAAEEVTSIAINPTKRVAVACNDGDSAPRIFSANGAASVYSKSTQIDLSNKGLDSSPVNVVATGTVIPQIENGYSLSFTIEDENGNTVNISKSQVGEIVDTSNITSTVITIRVDFEDTTSTLELENFACHFND